MTGMPWVGYEHVQAGQSWGVKQGKGPRDFPGVSVTMYGTDSAEGNILNRRVGWVLSLHTVCSAEAPL